MMNDFKEYFERLPKRINDQLMDNQRKHNKMKDEELTDPKAFKNLSRRSALKEFLIIEMAARVANSKEGTEAFESLVDVLIYDGEVNKERAKHLEEVFDISSEFFLGLYQLEKDHKEED